MLLMCNLCFMGVLGLAGSVADVMMEWLTAYFSLLFTPLMFFGLLLLRSTQLYGCYSGYFDLVLHVPPMSFGLPATFLIFWSGFCTFRPQPVFPALLLSRWSVFFRFLRIVVVQLYIVSGFSWALRLKFFFSIFIWVPTAPARSRFQ